MTIKKNPYRSVGWVEHFAKPIATSRTVMGIAEFIIGLFVENLIFRAIERNTVQKWGTQS